MSLTRKMKEVLYATGAFEIDDTFFDDTGTLRTITDVLVCHYMKRGSFRVLYEVDGSGEYVELKLRGFGELPQNRTQQSTPIRKLGDKSSLRLVPFQREEDPFFGKNNP